MDPLDISAEIAVLREALATLIAIQQDTQHPLTTEQLIKYLTMITREIMRGAGKQFAIQSAGGNDRLTAAFKLMAADVGSMMLTDDTE